MTSPKQYTDNINLSKKSRSQKSINSDKNTKLKNKAKQKHKKKIETKTIVLVQPKRKLEKPLANVENKVTNDIHTSLFVYPTYDETKTKRKKSKKKKNNEQVNQRGLLNHPINKNYFDKSYYDFAYEFSDLADKMEFKKGEHLHLELPLVMTNHAKKRRQERPCRKGDRIYNVINNEAIVTSFPIPKDINTNILKHLDNKMGAYRNRFLEI